jgi:hypothetical protein
LQVAQAELASCPVPVQVLACIRCVRDPVLVSDLGDIWLCNRLLFGFLL